MRLIVLVATAATVRGASLLDYCCCCCPSWWKKDSKPRREWKSSFQKPAQDQRSQKPGKIPRSRRQTQQAPPPSELEPEVLVPKPQILTLEIPFEESDLQNTAGAQKPGGLLDITPRWVPASPEAQTGCWSPPGPKSGALGGSLTTSGTMQNSEAEVSFVKLPGSDPIRSLELRQVYYDPQLVCTYTATYGIEGTLWELLKHPPASVQRKCDDEQGPENIPKLSSATWETDMWLHSESLCVLEQLTMIAELPMVADFSQLGKSGKIREIAFFDAFQGFESFPPDLSVQLVKQGGGVVYRLTSQMLQQRDDTVAGYSHSERFARKLGHLIPGQGKSKMMDIHLVEGMKQKHPELLAPLAERDEVMKKVTLLREFRGVRLESVTRCGMLSTEQSSVCLKYEYYIDGDRQRICFRTLTHKKKGKIMDLLSTEVASVQEKCHSSEAPERKRVRLLSPTVVNKWIPHSTVSNLYLLEQLMLVAQLPLIELVCTSSRCAAEVAYFGAFEASNSLPRGWRILSIGSELFQLTTGDAKSVIGTADDSEFEVYPRHGPLFAHRIEGLGFADCFEPSAIDSDDILRTARDSIMEKRKPAEEASQNLDSSNQKHRHVRHGRRPRRRFRRYAHHGRSRYQSRQNRRREPSKRRW